MNRIHPSLSSTAALCVLTLIAVPACSDDDDGSIEVAAPFQVRQSVEQLHITQAEPGTTLEVVAADGTVVASGTVDDLGSLIVRQLPPGDGYAVRVADGSEQVDDLTVMSVAGSTPSQEFYAGQVLEPGFGYIETRDGTLLSVYVQLPGPVEDGPYPTLINYSGYAPSRPGAPVSAAPASLCDSLPVLCDAPNHPSGLIAGVMGFATVGVNMRGTGCSGGAYDFFETLQLLDGYDIIETVAAQPWVKGNKVGMAGLSFPGISQLYVASMRPPSLAAITPLSVIADVQSILVPGGILNDGFAINWGQRVQDSADPFGQGWEQERVDAGDDICGSNQLLHGQKVDIIDKAYANPF
ncbi:MAG: CocE/NonD family hydrolase, partial [Myxococcota bacterium]